VAEPERVRFSVEPPWTVEMTTPEAEPETGGSGSEELATVMTFA